MFIHDVRQIINEWRRFIFEAVVWFSGFKSAVFIYKDFLLWTI